MEGLDLDVGSLLDGAEAPRIACLMEANGRLFDDLNREFPPATNVQVAFKADVLTARSNGSGGFEIRLRSLPTGEVVLHFDPLTTLLLMEVIVSAIGQEL